MSRSGFGKYPISRNAGQLDSASTFLTLNTIVENKNRVSSYQFGQPVLKN